MKKIHYRAYSEDNRLYAWTNDKNYADKLKKLGFNVLEAIK